MKPAENFQYTRKIYTREPITSIATLNDNLAILFVQKTDNSSSGDSNDDSDDNNDDDYEITVQIRTFRNKILADKTDFADAKGQTMVFSEPKSIHVHKNEEIIILEKRQFKVFDIDGRLKWYYKFNLQHLSGITFDSESNIYVCDKSTKKIQQIEANNYMKSRVLASLTENPTSILFDSKERTVVLGFDDNDSMHVYKFAREQKDTQSRICLKT